METFFLSLGGNMGDRLRYLKEAFWRLNRTAGIFNLTASSIYETEPIGYLDQPAFLNMVVGGETNQSAKELLHIILQIENSLGRKREIRWGPRTIDIDILTYGLLVFNEPDLVIPHPRMKERAFVLIPFAEIAGNRQIPHSEAWTTPSVLFQKLENKRGVKKWMNFDWEIESGHFES